MKARNLAAFGLIDVLETRVAETAAQRRREQAESETKRAAAGKFGVVGFAKVRLKWDAARNAFYIAGANLESAARTLLDHGGLRRRSAQPIAETGTEAEGDRREAAGHREAERCVGLGAG